MSFLLKKDKKHYICNMRKKILDIISWFVLICSVGYTLIYEDLTIVHISAFLSGFLLALLIYKRNKKCSADLHSKGIGGGGIKNPPKP